jgi:hypothetical protein
LHQKTSKAVRTYRKILLEERIEDERGAPDTLKHTAYEPCPLFLALVRTSAKPRGRRGSAARKKWQSASERE